jgi:glucuronide carrier protein
MRSRTSSPGALSTRRPRAGASSGFILFGSLPLLLLSVATFSVPDTSEGAQLAYAFVSYALLGLVYSIVNIPYGRWPPP